MSPRQALVRPTLAVLAGSGAALAASLGVRVLLARSLGPADLGVLLVAVAVVSGVGGLSSLGLNHATAKSLGELRAGGREGEARRHAGGALELAAISGVCVGAALVAAGFLVATEPTWAVLGRTLAAFAPAAAGLAVGYTMVGISRGFDDATGRPLVRDLGGGVFRLCGTGAAVLAGAGVAGTALGYAVGAVFGEGAFVAYGMLKGWVGRGGRPRALWRGLPPYWAIEALNQLTQWMDILLLGALASPVAVGLYGTARGLSRALQLVPLSGAHAVLPALAGSAADPETFAATYRRARMLVFALVWPALVALLVAPATVMSLVFGDPFRVAGGALRILALALVVDQAVAFKDLALLALGRSRRVATANGVATIAGAVALVVVVPSWGALGAAVAMLVLSVVRAVMLTRHLLVSGRTRLWRDDFPLSVLVALGVTAAAFAGTAAMGAGDLSRAAGSVAAALAGSAVVLLRLRP